MRRKLSAHFPLMINYPEFKTVAQTQAEQLHLDEFIRKGAQGRVYKARWINQTVAVKVVPISTADEKRAYLKEVALWQPLKHPRIVCMLKSIGGIQTSNSVQIEAGIVMELCGESLSSRLSDLSLEKSLMVAIQIAEGVQYLHKEGVVHRDLVCGSMFVVSRCRVQLNDVFAQNPNNILFASASATEQNIKICDFGLARPELSPTIVGAVGTVGYMSPEVSLSADARDVTHWASFG